MYVSIIFCFTPLLHQHVVQESSLNLELEGYILTLMFFIEGVGWPSNFGEKTPLGGQHSKKANDINHCNTPVNLHHGPSRSE